jgi:hypothetical protein
LITTETLSACVFIQGQKMILVFATGTSIVVPAKNAAALILGARPRANGEAAVGAIVFGSEAGPDLCSGRYATATPSPPDPVFFSAALRHHIDGKQAIRLHITKDGKQFVDYDERADGTAFDCYGNRDSLGALDAGVYAFQVLHGGDVEAAGTLTINWRSFKATPTGCRRRHQGERPSDSACLTMTSGIIYRLRRAT